jgi:hypothetical protein
VTVLVCVVLPEVAEIVTVDVPVGVPGICTTGGGVLPPPPQEIRAVARDNTPSSIKADRRRFLLARPAASTRPTPKPKKPPPVSNPDFNPGAGGAAVGAVVVMVSIVLPVLPFTATEGGLKEQLASEGKPVVQLKLMVPPKPFTVDTLMV